MSHTYLPNGCWFTAPAVNPSNWKSSKASVKKPWYFGYRFYDPTHKNDYPNGKYVAVRGMNHLSSQTERMAVTAKLLENELTDLTVHGYNPITGSSTPFYNTDSDIIPEMPLPVALEAAFKKVKGADSTLSDMKSCLTYIQKAIKHARLYNMQVGAVTRKYVVKILEACEMVKETWTAHTYNKYRTYLLMLFKVLVKYEAMEANPVREIEKDRPVKRIKEVLNQDQRKKISDHLQKTAPAFYRYMQIFFHSGSRSTELFTLRVKDVNLEKQQYKLLVKKGKQQKEVLKTIKTIALPFWKDLLAGHHPSNHYIFSKGLSPGIDMIRSDQINKRWNRHVKKKLNISCDFYSLKHLNTTEVVDLLSEQDAAKLNAHEDTAMVVKIYDVRRDDRQHERLKKVNNEF
jgi:site-specific recombinase XerC